MIFVPTGAGRQLAHEHSAIRSGKRVGGDADPDGDARARGPARRRLRRASGL